MVVSVELLRSLVTPFLEQDGQVYVALGCNRIYVASTPAGKCRRCGSVHESRAITSLEAVSQLVLDLS